MGGGGEAGRLLSVRRGRSGVGSRLTCQTPTMALAMRIRRMTKGSTKAVTVSSPSSNQASTWGAGRGRMTGAGAPPTGTESPGGEDRAGASSGPQGTARPRAGLRAPRGHTALPADARGTGGTGGTGGRHHHPGPGKDAFSFPWLGCWLVSEAQGTPRPTTPTATSISWEPNPEEKPPGPQGAGPPTPLPQPGWEVGFQEGAGGGIELPPPVHTPPQLLPLPGKGDSHRQMSRSKSEKGEGGPAS